MAAVLCGGRSRRMGEDKALLEVGGVPLAARVAGAARAAGAAGVVAVGGDGEALAVHGLSWVPDRWPGEGPLGGILTALGHGGGLPVLVVACDLVHPCPEAMAATVAGLVDRGDADLAVPVPEPAPGAGRAHEAVPQWLHAAWRGRVHAPLAEAFDRGQRAVHRAVDEAGLSVARVPGIGGASLADADTPGDLR